VRPINMEPDIRAVITVAPALFMTDAATAKLDVLR